MENASKALIIAGAILISIVLVSVGVLVVNSLDTGTAIDKISAQEVESFNSTFTTRAGLNRQGSVVRTLLSDIITNNTQNKDGDAKQIKVTTTNLTDASANQADVTDPNTIASIRNAINSSSRYDISYTIKTDSGLVDVITINKR